MKQKRSHLPTIGNKEKDTMEAQGTQPNTGSYTEQSDGPKRAFSDELIARAEAELSAKVAGPNKKRQESILRGLDQEYSAGNKSYSQADVLEHVEKALFYGKKLRESITFLAYGQASIMTMDEITSNLDTVTFRFCLTLEKIDVLSVSLEGIKIELMYLKAHVTPPHILQAKEAEQRSLESMLKELNNRIAWIKLEYKVMEKTKEIKETASVEIVSEQEIGKRKDVVHQNYYEFINHIASLHSFAPNLARELQELPYDYWLIRDLQKAIFLKKVKNIKYKGLMLLLALMLGIFDETEEEINKE